MQTIRVPLAERAYPIYVGHGLLDDFPALITPYVRGKQVMVVTNTTVAPLYLNRLKTQLADSHEVDEILLPDGEQYKTLTTAGDIFDRLVRQCHRRSTLLIALGGGVVGDITGFVAACYQRGVDFIQVPTTLLAQVDAAVGGKTGVNHPLGKNLIGAFYQPRCVISDVACLATLPVREFRAGLAEVVKYGLIYDAAFFSQLEETLDDILTGDPELLVPLISRCCELKAQAVVDDEQESHRRMLLNFGHTVGHAVESGLGYSPWLHGEAVALGMMVAARLSVALGKLDQRSFDRIERWLIRAGLPTTAPEGFSIAACKSLMAHDKKANDEGLRFVILNGIGQATVVEVDAPLLDKALAETRFQLT